MKSKPPTSLERELEVDLKRIAGLRCLGTKLFASVTLIIYLDEGLRPKSHMARCRLWIECAWRLELASGIVVGYCDEDHQVLAWLRRLHGLAVVSARYAKRTRDLVVEFEGGITFRAFVNSVGNEQWQLRGADGSRIGIAEGLVVAKETVAPDAEENGNGSAYAIAPPTPFDLPPPSPSKEEKARDIRNKGKDRGGKQ